MTTSTPQLFRQTLRNVGRIQLVSAVAIAFCLLLLFIAMHTSIRNSDDELNGIPELTDTQNTILKTVYLTNRIAKNPDSANAQELKELHQLNLHTLALSQRFEHRQGVDLKLLARHLMQLHGETKIILIRSTLHDSTEINLSSEQVQKQSIDANSLIQHHINEALRTHDKRNARQHEDILVLGIAISFLLACTLLLGPCSSLVIISTTTSKLKNLSRIRGDFLANLTHEIRTPINGIVGMSDLLLEQPINFQARHYVRTLQTSAEHLLGLINDVLDFSKLEAGHMQLHNSRFNLYNLAQDVLNIMSGRADAKNIELILDYNQGSAHEIESDPARIRQILFNIVGNAIKFTERGYVLVRIRTSSGRHPHLFCQIEDTGAGIPENKIADLFKKYAQIENTSDKAKDGTGLGLAICKNLLHLMGGYITVKSKPGRGTNFLFKVPVRKIYTDASLSEKASRLDGRRIVIMDDLAPNRLLYKKALESLGATCLLAENAEELKSCLAYELNCSRQPDMIILDQFIPDTTGIACARHVVKHDRLEKIPIIILTTRAKSSFIDELAAIPTASYLLKPFTPAQLCRQVGDILTGKRHEQQITTTNPPVTQFSLNVLLAEDNRVNAEISTGILKGYGCNVTLAENGLEAYNLAQKDVFDLIFMDCQMPVMDGFEAAERLSLLMKQQQMKLIPIIALTANAADGDRELCLEAGMCDYLSKPIRRPEMLEVLKKYGSSKSVISNPVDNPEVKKPPALDYPIDQSLFESACAGLGERASVIIDYYIEDSAQYLLNLQMALANGSHDEGILPAHSLKSSSKQFGLIRLSDLAELMEKHLRECNRMQMNDNSFADTLKQMSEELKFGHSFLLEQKQSRLSHERKSN